jgi:hypothetical protein
MTYVFHEDGLAVNVMYTIDDAKKRAVGFKLSEGMEAPRSRRTGGRPAWARRTHVAG